MLNTSRRIWAASSFYNLDDGRHALALEDQGMLILISGTDHHADSSESFQLHLVIAAEKPRENQEHHDPQDVGEREHDENVWVAEVLDGDNNSRRSIALGRAEPTDIFKMVVSKSREISESKSRGDEQQADQKRTRSDNLKQVGKITDQ